MHVQVNGANIYYLDEGPRDGMPVMFLHGFPFSHAMWAKQIAVASERYRVVAYDIRGHGLSDVGDGQYTIEGHVDDLFGIMKALHIEKPVIVGLSMGGYITLRALERAQGRFRGAVLCDTRSEADTNESKQKRFSVIDSIKRIGAEPFAREFLKGIFAPGAEERVPEAVATIRDIITHTPPLSIAGTQLALASRTDTTAALAGFRLPVLIMVGEHDQSTPVAAAESMHQSIPHALLQVIPGAAHMSNMENPGVFNEALMQFLAVVERL